METIERAGLVFHFNPEILGRGDDAFLKRGGETPPKHHLIWNRVHQKHLSCNGPYNIPVFRACVTFDEEGRYASSECEDGDHNDRLKVLMVSGMHPREWESQMIVCRFLECLSGGEQQTTLGGRDRPKTVEMHVISLVNLPGYLATILGHTERGVLRVYNREGELDPIKCGELEIRHTRKTFCDYGVDLNRNFDFFWTDKYEGAQCEEDSEIFPGLGPFSEPEAKFLRGYCDKHGFDVVLDMHDYGDFVMEFPMADMSFSGDHHKRATVMMLKYLYVDPIMCEASRHFFGKGRPVKPYKGNGLFSDWVTAEKRAIGMTLEIGSKGNAFNSAGEECDQMVENGMKMVFQFLFKNYDTLLRTSREMKEFIF